MNQTEFIKAFKRDINYWVFDNAFIVYSDKEVYEIETGESQYFETWESLMSYEHDGKTIADYVENLKDLNIEVEGGRGASGSSRALFGGQGGGQIELSYPDLPARMNRMYNGNRMSQEHTVETFRTAHASARTEHMIAYDDNGFVSYYAHGGKSSVGFMPQDVAGKVAIHSHPSGSNFSKADLDSFASTQAKGIIATSTRATYSITKTSKFDAKGFSKALNSAKTSDSDYNKAVDTFLRRNSRKYGYTYSATIH